MDTNQLRQLEAIARLGTVTAAAAELHMSQPALSRSMERLGRSVGHELLVRDGRNVRVSEAGAVVLDHARVILREERLMERELEERARRVGTIVVGTVAPAPLWRLMATALERRPDQLVSTVPLREDEVERAVAEGRVDLGIGLGASAHPALESRHYMDEHLSVALPEGHPLTTRPSLAFSDLDGETFLLQSTVGFWVPLVKRAMPRARFVLHGDRDTYLLAVRESPALAFVTDQTDPAFLEGWRTAVPIEDEAARQSFFLLMHRDAPPAVRSFFDDED